MRYKLGALILAISAAGQVHAQFEELIFQSSFETGEDCVVLSSLNYNIMVPVVSITGDFTLNGGAFPQTQYDNAVLSLRDRDTGDVFELGKTHENSYSVNIVAGQYDVMYSVKEPGANIPLNVGAMVMENVVLLTDQTLDINLTSYQVSGDLLLNSVPFPATQYDDGVIFLDSVVQGRLEIGETRNQVFEDVVVLAGDYDIRYQLQDPGALVPWNEWGFVDSVNIAGNNNALDINVESLQVKGSFSHNDAPMLATQYDDGNFYLETSAGDRIHLENSHELNYQRNIIPGNYDIFWELEDLGDSVPFNPRARIGSNVSVATGKLNINMRSYQLSGDFTHNGIAFPGNIQDTGQIVFHDTVTGTENVLALTADGSYDQRVVKGAYAIVYQHLQGEDVPQNKNAVINAGIVVKSPTIMDINVVSRLFSSPVFHNNVLFTASAQQHGNILLRDPDSEDLVHFGKTSLQNLSKRIVPGSYDVYYSHLNGADVPQNTMARVHENLVVPPPGPMFLLADVQLNVSSYILSGQMLLNDAPMPATEYDKGLLRLKREEDTVFLANTNDQTFQVRVVNRTEWADFQVHYEVLDPGASIPINEDARIMCVRLEPPLF